MHQPPPLMNNKTKRNSRGSENWFCFKSNGAPTPVELRMELGGEGVRERDTASPAMAAGVKEPPKSKWRKVGSAGTATKTTPTESLFFRSTFKQSSVSSS